VSWVVLRSFANTTLLAIKRASSTSREPLSVCPGLVFAMQLARTASFGGLVVGIGDYSGTRADHKPAASSARVGISKSRNGRSSSLMPKYDLHPYYGCMVALLVHAQETRSFAEMATD
jgi:hypothetical protein